MAVRSSRGHSEGELKKVFSKFDKNGDGKISISELGSVMEALGSTPSEKDLKSAMTDFDKNGDGFIDLKEFADFFGAGDEKELREAFGLYDRNGNGTISAGELHDTFKRLGEKVSLKECKNMISRVDVDGDGSVNFEEFKKMMKGGGN